MSARTWGPFTGAQLTMIILGITAALAVPGSLWAVATSAVSVTDAANGHTAAVSSARRLFVSALNEEAPIPAAFFHPAGVELSTTDCQPLGAPPSGKGAVITAVRINAVFNPSPDSGTVAIFKDANCSIFFAGVAPPSVGQTTVPFNPGVATKTGLFAHLFGSSMVAEYFVDGYLVPASQVP